MSLLQKLRKFILELLALLAHLIRLYTDENEAKGRRCDCVCPPALKKPDPFLYCQYYLMSLGYPVTWDNPDIYIFEGSTPVNAYDLQANTAYTVVARIWNSSTDIPVVNLGVQFSYLSFGIGTQSHPIGTTTTNLGVKGMPGCPAFAYMTWTTPAALGHYCLQVLLTPPDDSNWLNNLGQRNTQVAQPQSPAVFTFAVGNHHSRLPRTLRFKVDTYSIPPLASCDEIGNRGRDRRAISKLAPSVPDGWTVVISPDDLQLDPGEERPVQAAITPPPGFSGKLPFNVSAYDGTRLIGGVTLTVEQP